jgi:hypothetical protein
MESMHMNLIYNSDQYSVVEFTPDNSTDTLRSGGYEIMDKSFNREIFLAGSMAEEFRKEVKDLIASEPSIEDIDSFLGHYDSFMRQPMVLH